MRNALPLAFVLVAAAPLAAQQVADTAFRPVIARPAYPAGAGPVVAIDGGHGNFHTVDGRYAPFAALLRRDGYVVRGLTGPLMAEALRGVAVLVIANPLHQSNVGNWTLPTPSAYAPDEIAAVHAWVEGGGALLLIADHMPFAGAAGPLASALRLEYTNGFTRDTTRAEPLVFRRADGSLEDHAVTRGRSPDERVDSVVTFTGSAFAGPATVAPLLVLGPAAFSLNPRTAWQFDSTTTIVPVGGWLQGAMLRVGRGRVAAFGEAAMFSAQLGSAQRNPMGMNHPGAPQNARFLLNVLHWLTGVLE